MTMTCLSIAKALWLRATGQSEWCRCIVCRDKFLNKPDPLNFSEDARKFQKRLRRWPKTYKRRKSREHKNENDKDDLHGIANKLTYEEPIPKTQNKDNDEVRSHPAPSSGSIPETPRRRDVDVSEPRPLVTKMEKSVRFAEPLHEEDCGERFATSTSTPEEEQELASEGDSIDRYVDYFDDTVSREKGGQRRKEGALRILSSLNSILEDAASTASGSFELEGNPIDDLWKYDELDLYEVRPPRKFPQRATALYHDDESMNSYGTISSRELMEEFQKAKEDNLVASLSGLNDNRPACINDSYLYTDLVYVSSPHKI